MNKKQSRDVGENGSSGGGGGGGGSGGGGGGWWSVGRGRAMKAAEQQSVSCRCS